MFAIRLLARQPSEPAGATLVKPAGAAPDDDGDAVAREVAELLRTADEPARAGAVQMLPRPLRTPAKVVIVGVGDGDESDWRSAGAAAARAVPGDEELRVALPAGTSEAAVRGLAEGLWLGGYRYREAPEKPRAAGVDLIVDHPEAYE